MQAVEMKVSIEELIGRYPKLDREKGNIIKAFEVINECYKNKGKLLVAGNGGSAADTEHIVGELMKSFVEPRRLPKEYINKLEAVDHEMGKELGEKLQVALPAISLVGNVKGRKELVGTFYFSGVYSGSDGVEKFWDKRRIAEIEKCKEKCAL